MKNRTAPLFKDRTVPFFSLVLLLATTTSLQDSGILDELVPIFEKSTGYRVKTIAVGTGQALAMVRGGEVDCCLVHSKEAEEELVAQGFGVGRRPIMHNRFLLVGPKYDPAKVKGSKSIAWAFAEIAKTKRLFVSRGDSSGTHRMEMNIWNSTGIQPKGDWYIQTGLGMGHSLQVADQKDAYCLTDSSTYISQREWLGLVILVDEAPPLVNTYSYIQVNHERFPKINSAGAKAFGDFLVSEQAGSIIENFGVDKYNEPLFVLEQP